MGLDWKIRESHDLAHALLEALSGVGELHSPRVGRAGFAVLKAVDIPAVLIETGFMTHPAEEKALQQKIQSDFQRTINTFGETPVTPSNTEDAVRLIEWPMQVRGFGPVRTDAFKTARKEMEQRESAFRSTRVEHHQVA